MVTDDREAPANAGAAHQGTKDEERQGELYRIDYAQRTGLEQSGLWAWPGVLVVRGAREMLLHWECMKSLERVIETAPLAGGAGRAPCGDCGEDMEAYRPVFFDPVSREDDPDAEGPVCRDVATWDGVLIREKEGFELIRHECIGEGDLVVEMTPIARAGVSPTRCVRCGAPIDGYRSEYW